MLLNVIYADGTSGKIKSTTLEGNQVKLLHSIARKDG